MKHQGLSTLHAILVLTLSTFSATEVLAQRNSTSHSTTYIHTVQEERSQTRWTLTEWLRIKERMKLMDVWLAMFSPPSEPKTPRRLRLELSLNHNVQNGHFYVDGDRQEAESLMVAGQSRGQVYLTNVLHAMTGVSLLNIDFGGEYFSRSSSNIEVNPKRLGELSNLPATDRGFDLTYYSGNMRLLGDHVQDSSLVFKYGRYELTSSLPYAFEHQFDTSQTGSLLGIELQVYLTKAIGIESNYLHLTPERPSELLNAVRGSMLDNGLFFEASFLRLMVAQYQNYWHHSGDNGRYLIKERGYLAGLKLQL